MENLQWSSFTGLTPEANAAPPPAYTTRRPPSLNTADASVPPPEYTFPATFSVGSGRTTPFVDSEQVKGHLALLCAFALLRSRVDAMTADPMLEDKDRKWAFFIGLAVER